MKLTDRQWGLLIVGTPIVFFSSWAIFDNPRLYFVTLLNGLTLASLYFIVASGFTLVFGLMRNVNLAHGSLYLLGGYVGFMIAEKSGWWLLAVAGGFLSAALAGLLLQVFVLRHMQGQELRQTMVTIGISIVIADLLLWSFTAQVHQMDPPIWLQGPIRDIPLIKAYSAYRLSLLVFGIAIGILLWWMLTKTKVGAMIRAGARSSAPVERLWGWKTTCASCPTTTFGRPSGAAWSGFWATPCSRLWPPSQLLWS